MNAENESNNVTKFRPKQTNKSYLQKLRNKLELQIKEAGEQETKELTTSVPLCGI